MANADCTPTHTCAHCGKPYEGSAKSIYCSKGCRSRAGYKRRYRKAKENGAHKRAVGEAHCLECGMRFTVYHNTKGMYCSKSCAGKGHPKRRTIAKKAEMARKARDLWLSKNQGAFSPVMDATCLHCQKVHTKSQGAGRFCCVECREAEAEQHKKWTNRMLFGQPLTQIKICPETGWLFKPEHNGQRYATREIAYKVGRRTAKAKRRARKKNNGRLESIDPIAVFRSVYYVCQICGCQTEEDKRGMIHDRAPQLDHIIPLAKGGTHTWGNVQCACLACNIAKSDSLPKKHRVDQRVLAL